MKKTCMLCFVFLVGGCYADTPNDLTQSLLVTPLLHVYTPQKLQRQEWRERPELVGLPKNAKGKQYQKPNKIQWLEINNKSQVIAFGLGREFNGDWRIDSAQVSEVQKQLKNTLQGLSIIKQIGLAECQSLNLLQPLADVVSSLGKPHDYETIPLKSPFLSSFKLGYQGSNLCGLPQKMQLELLFKYSKSRGYLLVAVSLYKANP